jgi:2-polyprenyl-3-methyl-5-hydroxy-6-metoxy-1,4-benzoquinol methylase
LEHIPRPRDVLVKCREHLRPNGLLAITVPSSRGLFYRLSVALRRIGLRGPYDRMWQRQFYTPHVSYFHETNLRTLSEGCGFKLIHSEALRSVQLSGLWGRLRCDTQAPVLFSATVYLGVVLLAPLLRVVPSDCLFQVYQRCEP